MMNGATAASRRSDTSSFSSSSPGGATGAGRRFIAGGPRAVVYALSLAVYCTSWTYYGSVGLASSRGLDFLPIYIGPILVIGLGSAFVGRIAGLARAQNLTTVADFVSARYGKSQRVAAVAALIALVGSAPYVALQLKAVSTTLLTVVASLDKPALVAGRPSAAVLARDRARARRLRHRLRHAPAQPEGAPGGADPGDRGRVDRQAGGVPRRRRLRRVGDERRPRRPDAGGALEPEDRRRGPDAAGPGGLGRDHAAVGFRDFCCCRGNSTWRWSRITTGADIRTASWLFPAYLVLINLFVAPLAIAGLTMFPDGAIDRDLTVLALPLAAHAHGLALFTMIGGLSAATGMIVVDSLALAITISNDLVMPLLLRRKAIPTQARRPGRHRRAGALGAQAVDPRRARARLRLRAADQRNGARVDRAPLVRRGRPDRAGLSRRPVLAARHRAGRARRHDGGLVRLALPPAPALARRRTARSRPIWRTGRSRSPGSRPPSLTAFAPNALVGGVVVSLGLNLAGFVAFSLCASRPRSSGRRRTPSPAPAASRRRSACGARRPPRASSRPPSPAISGRRGRGAPSPPSSASAARITTPTRRRARS